MLLENNEIKLKGEYVVLVNIDKSEEAVDKKRKRENSADEIEQVEIDVINHVKGIYFYIAPYSIAYFSHVKGNTGNKRQDTNEVDDNNTTILLFYAYCDPPMDRKQQDDAVAFCHSTLKKYECTGRLRIGKEGYNGTLTGPQIGIR